MLASVAGGGNEEEGFVDVRYGGGNVDKIFDYRVYGMSFNRSPDYHQDGRNFDDWRYVQGGFRMDWKKDGDAYTLQGDIYERSGRRESELHDVYAALFANFGRECATLRGKYHGPLEAEHSATAQTYRCRFIMTAPIV